MSESKTSEKLDFSLPRFDTNMRKRKNRESLERFLRNKTPDYFTDRQDFFAWYHEHFIWPQTKIRFWQRVRKYMGLEAEEQMRDELRRQGGKRQVKGSILRGDRNVLAKTRSLHDKIDILVRVPESYLTKTIIVMRGLGVSVEEVAEKFHVDTEVIEKIATPEAIAAIDSARFPDLLMKATKMKAIQKIASSAVSGNLSLRDALAILEKCIRYEHSKNRGAPDEGKRITDADYVEEIEARHKQFLDMDRKKEQDVAKQNS